MFWQRVSVETPAEVVSATGAVTPTWTPFLADVEARLLPLTTEETHDVRHTPEEDVYEVQLRGVWTIHPTMRVVAPEGYFDIRKVATPPPFGEPTMVLHAVRITP